MHINEHARPGTGTQEGIRRALEAMRAHLSLDVAFVSQIRDGRRVFVYVDAEDDGCPVQVGGSDPVEESYCQYVIDGRIPQLLTDPSQHPVASQLQVTSRLPVGTHVSVPIQLGDGRVYGTFCCFSFDVHEDLDERDLAAVRMLARVVSSYIEDEEAAREETRRRREQLRAIRPGSGLVMVFQPIVGLEDLEVAGYEALARFPELGEPPDRVFADAWRVGVGEELEMAAIRCALEALPRLPGEVYLSVNAAPATLTGADFYGTLDLSSVDSSRLVVEVTEHAAVEDYDALLTALTPMAEAGVRLAIDDVGMGFSGLNHIVNLSPHVIKIDASLVRDVHSCTVRQAMIAALTGFAARTGMTVVAEGIETEDELDALRVLGVRYGQGFHISRPGDLPDALHAATRPAGTVRGHSPDPAWTTVGSLREQASMDL